MFECSSARYFEPRSITACGTCDEAALSRYTSGFPFTVCDRTGKSALIRSTSHVLIVDTAFMFGNLCIRRYRLLTACRALLPWPRPALSPRTLPRVSRRASPLVLPPSWPPVWLLPLRGGPQAFRAHPDARWLLAHLIRLPSDASSLRV